MKNSKIVVTEATMKPKKKKAPDCCGGDRCVIEDFCNKPDPQGYYVCTLKTGHKGDHVACSGGNHDMKSWPNRQKETQ